MNTLTDTELAAFASQMNMVLKAGMAPVEGIQIMLDEAEDEDTEKILNRLNDSLLIRVSLYAHGIGQKAHSARSDTRHL